ncbi:MAG: putative sulfate exporter family transporter [Gaiellaceae bacterium MAG52_C11]|nr:putative sulfate exporter family transporter [Candidatus Gaiellasilicea maunaloa]
MLRGLAWLGLATGAALAIHRGLPAIPPFPLALALGLAAANLGLLRGSTRAASRAAADPLLRIGIVLLGFELAAGDVLELGAERLAVVLAVVVLTFAGTRWLGRRLGLSGPLSLLIAAGFSICGASAIAALRNVVDADEEEVTAAIGLVTLCGTLAIVVLPLLQGPLGLDDEAFGAWSGASVHDVAQVVATASTAGPVALAAAVVVKLTRVLLLAPLVASVSLTSRLHSLRSHRISSPVPLFVLGFLVAIALRTAGVVPDPVLDVLGDAKTLALTAALAGIGAGTDLRKLGRLGSRPLVLGLLSWALVASVAYAGVVVTD